MIKTYLSTDNITLRANSVGGTLFERIGTFVVPRDSLVSFDPTRPGLFLLFATQKGLTPAADKTITLPSGIVIPRTGHFQRYVQAVGVVNGETRELTVTAVDEEAGRITIAETVDSGTNVDVCCVPRIPFLVEFRISPPKSGLELTRTVFTMELSAEAERDYWKTGSQLLIPGTYVLPEDWLLEFWVLCALPGFHPTMV